MWAIRICIAVLLLFAAAFAQQPDWDASWDKVRYNGGTLQTSVDPKDWENFLQITAERVTFRLKDGQGLVIPAKDVTSLSYGQEAHRRMGTMGVIIAPVGLLKLLHKSRLHFIGLEFTSHGDKGELLLQGDKDNYQAILNTLQKVTQVPVSVSEKDRPFVPSTAKTVIINEPEAEVSNARK
jgi:hypothetical protein